MDEEIDPVREARRAPPSRAPARLNWSALVALLIESLIGDTILANLILIGAAFLMLINAVMIYLGEMIKRRDNSPPLGLIVSLALLAIIAWRAVGDSIPAGYGP